MEISLLWVVRVSHLEMPCRKEPCYPFKGAVRNTCHLTSCHLSTLEQSVCYLMLNRQSTPVAASNLSLLALTGDGCEVSLCQPPCRCCTWGQPCNHSGPPQSPARHSADFHQFSPGNVSQLCRAKWGIVSTPGKIWGGPSGINSPCCLLLHMQTHGHMYSIVSLLNKQTLAVLRAGDIVDNRPWPFPQSLQPS